MPDDEVIKRDTILQAYFFLRDWDRNGEFESVRTLVIHRREMLPSFPYVFDYEWEMTPGNPNEGRGDLLFTDGAGGYAAIEVKYIPPESTRNIRRRNREKREKAKEQVARYGRAVFELRPDAQRVTLMTYNNEDGLEEIDEIMRRYIFW